MKQELVPGVHLTVTPTKQFKTISVLISFCSKARLETLTTRSLLADLLETSSTAYPTQTKLAAALSHMYGANYNTNVTKVGALAQFQFALTLPNGRYLADKPELLADGVAFLNEVMNRPLLGKTTTGEVTFEPETFSRQQKNLATALDSVSEDKMLYARLQAQRLHFGDTIAAYPSAGREEDVAGLTATSVYQEYQRMLSEDEVFIYVLGDVDATETVADIQTLALQPRKSSLLSLTMPQPEPNHVQTQVEHQSLTQAKLDLIYHLPVHYGKSMYYAAQVFNGLFGGTPLSLLFSNVREKQSLAYYANSSVNFFNQTMTVQAGIDGEKAAIVEKIIGEQLNDLATGKFSDQRLQQVKETLINQREAAQDAPRLLIGTDLLGDLTGSSISVEDWVTSIVTVSAEDVAAVARLATLATSYLLSN